MHFSLWDDGDRNRFYDADAPDRLSPSAAPSSPACSSTCPGCAA